jgi:hypothetical protein
LIDRLLKVHPSFTPQIGHFVFSNCDAGYTL